MASLTDKRMDALLIKIRDEFDLAAACMNKLLIESGLEPVTCSQTLGPVAHVTDLPTLDVSTRRSVTPALSRRFAFCGRWRRFDEVWLSVKQMETVARNRDFKRHFKAKQQHWNESAPAVIPPDRLSVFSVSSHAEGDYTFLVWPDSSRVVEPELWRYHGQSESRFKNLEAFLRWVAAS